MEISKSYLRASGQRSSTSDSALRPTTSATLALYSRPDQQIPSQCDIARPPTSSTSSHSGSHPEWDPTGHSYYGSRATVGLGLHEPKLPIHVDKIQTSSDIDDLNLEPDEFWPRSDSDDDLGSSRNALKRTTTAKSTTAARKIKAILQKFGRSYNKNYSFLPNDSQEKDRNTLQHNIVLETLDGKLYLAPVVNARRVLDLGCGPGDWPLEFARRNPNTIVLGIDIDPIKPTVNLPNYRFQVANFEDKWAYDAKFDFIHLRHLGDLPSREVIASIYENLSPGGWAEFTEWVVSMQSTNNNSFVETSLYKWLSYWKSGLKKDGRTVHYPLQYKSLLSEMGFRNVTERKYAVPVNPWPPGKQLQKIGDMMATNLNIILEPISMPVFMGILGWSRDQLDSLLHEVRKEIADTNLHAFMTLHTVYAQKPRGESSAGSSVRSSELG